MISFFKRLMGHNDKFFVLLEASATEAQKSVDLLTEMMKGSEDAIRPMDELSLTRRKDKRITEEISEELCRTFVTPMDREDIEGLSTELYKITKTVQRFSEKFILCKHHVCCSDFSNQIDVVGRATKTVVDMVRKLGKKPSLEDIKEQNDQLHRLEAEADRMMMDLRKVWYSGNHDPLQIIVGMDLHETLEEVVDRCRDAGNVIFQIVLKYS